MRRKSAMIRSIASWLFASTFLLIGVFAAQTKKFNINSNFRFEAEDVLAEITVFEVFLDRWSEAESYEHEEVKQIVLSGDKQQVEPITLGDEGIINFTTAFPVYSLKIEIKNTFKSGGRNILIDYDLNFFDTNGCLEIKDLLPDELDITENWEYILPPGESAIFYFVYILDAHKSCSFDTSEINDFSLGYITLTRG